MRVGALLGARDRESHAAALRGPGLRALDELTTDAAAARVRRDHERRDQADGAGGVQYRVGRDGDETQRLLTVDGDERYSALASNGLEPRRHCPGGDSVPELRQQRDDRRRVRVLCITNDQALNWRK